TILMFSSGKLVVTGAKSAEMIRKAVEIISELLRETGHNIAHEVEIIVNNIVASGTLGKSINLELAALLLEHTMYEPEQFPGLIYRMQKPKVVLLLFHSGKLVCTGAKTEEDVYQSIQKIYFILTEIDAF
ncbi:MAG: TATA box-binding protein, partial [Candidatus Hodarchaeota archaeon]